MGEKPTLQKQNSISSLFTCVTQVITCITVTWCFTPHHPVSSNRNSCHLCSSLHLRQLPSSFETIDLLAETGSRLTGRQLLERLYGHCGIHHLVVDWWWNPSFWWFNPKYLYIYISMFVVVQSPLWFPEYCTFILNVAECQSAVVKAKGLMVNHSIN